MIHSSISFIGLDKVSNKKFERKIVNILLSISFTYVLGAQKNRLIETVLLRTHSICFGREIRFFATELNA